MIEPYCTTPLGIWYRATFEKSCSIDVLVVHATNSLKRFKSLQLDQVPAGKYKVTAWHTYTA
jgi:hypothetical protein